MGPKPVKADPAVRSWKAEARSLSQRSHALDLERQRSLRDLGLDDDETLTRAREADKARLGQELWLRRTEFASIRDQVDALRSGDPLRAAQLGALRRRRRRQEEPEDDDQDDLGLQRFDESLASFRQTMRKEYDALRTQEVSLVRELDAAAKRFDKAFSNDDDTPAPIKRVVKKKEGTTTSEKVLAINEELAADPTGGWSEEDHDAFIRAWPKIIKIGTRTSDEIKDHSKWYKQRLDAVKERKNLLSAWREQKEEAKVVVEAPRMPRKKEDDADRDRRAAARAAAKAWRYLKDLETREIQRKKDLDREHAERQAAERRAARRAMQRAQIDAKKAQAQPPPPPPPPEQHQKKQQRVDLDAKTRRALRAAAERRAKVVEKSEAIHRHADRLKRLAAFVPKNPTAQHRDSHRLLRPTTASKFREFSYEEADVADDLRAHQRAHARPIPLGGYDLIFGGGRATPDWRK